MKMNKKLIAVMMTVVTLGALVGCGKAAVTPTPDVSITTPAPEENTATPEVTTNPEEEVVGEQDPTVASELMFVITDGLELPNQMPMDSQMFVDSYGIDPDLLKSYQVNMPLMNVKANECAVFELKDAADVEVVLEGIAKRQAALEEQWKMYLPDQYELVKNYKTAVKDNLVLFVIDDQAEAIVERFNTATAEQ